MKTVINCLTEWDNLLSADKSEIGGTAGRYAVALFELTEELPKAQRGRVIDDVAGLKTLIDSSADLQKLIESPIISAEDQSAALGAVLDKAGAQPLVKNFVGLVVAKRRAAVLADIATHYSALIAAARDEMVAQVTTAHDLGTGQVKALKGALSKVYGKDIIVEAETDATLLGGMIVKMGSQMVDGSLRSKLNSLKTALTSEAD